MPWLLAPGTGDSRELYWDDVYRGDGSKIIPKDWEMPCIVPPPETWPLPFRQATKHKVVPDLCAGRYTNVIFMSQAFRKLVEAMDPVQHHYIPLHLYLHGGRESIGEYFLFKFGSFVDGIVADQSEVGPIYRKDGTLSFYSTGHSPRIAWRRGAIEGRHVWADRYLQNRLFCSDVFLQEVEQRKMKLFRKVESIVIDDIGAAS